MAHAWNLVDNTQACFSGTSCLSKIELFHWNHKHYNKYVGS